MDAKGRGALRRRTIVSVLALVLLTVPASFAAAGGNGGKGGGHEDPSLRTRTSVTEVEPDGRHLLKVYAGPVNYRDANGAWQTIDNHLVPASGSTVVNAANSFKVDLPVSLESAPVTIDQGGASVGFSLDGAHAQGVVSGSHDLFAGALPATDVAYDVGNGVVKETLTLHDASAPSTFTYSLTSSVGLNAKLDHAGGLSFTGPNGASLDFAPPSVTDAAGATTSKVKFQLDRGGSQLRLVVDKHWLVSSARSWPVVIDPSFIAQGADRECFIRNGADADASFCGGSSFDVGFDGTQTSRSLLVWDLSSDMPSNAIVQSAQLGLYVQGTSGTPGALEVHNVTSPWTAAVTWNDADVIDGTATPWATPGGDFTPAAAATAAAAPVGSDSTWDLTSLVQSWVNGSVTNNGLIVKQSPESSPGVVHFATTSAPLTSQMPYLQVSYDVSPETTITAGPSGSTSSSSATFRFSSDTYGSTFQCSLDGSAYAACASPQSYAGLAAGSHSFGVRAVSPGGTVDPTPATRSWTVTAGSGSSGSPNLLSNGSFEGSLAGWSASSSTLSLANDGKTGPGAAKPRRSSGSTFGLAASPQPVASGSAGAVYTASGWLRSDTPGRNVCLAIREWSRSGALVSSHSTCLTSATAWQQFTAVRHTVSRSGDSLDVAITESGAASGDSFEVDGLTLTAG